jgi:4-nitrophenyl phosphatase
LAAVAIDLQRLRGFLIDLDGVVYTGKALVAGAAEFFALLRERGIPFLLITNNSTRGSEEVTLALREMGIMVEQEEVLTSAQATAEFLASTSPKRSRVFVIGEHGLRSAIEMQGFTLADDPEVEFVVVGLDREFDYRKLTIAIRAVLQGAQFVGPNPDTTLPMEDGLWPGAGALQAAITAATGVQPLIIGKPEPTMLSIGLGRLGCAPEQAAIVGDRLDTDVQGGRRAGLVTILVLSGVSTAETAAASPIEPDYVVRDLAELGERLRPQGSGSGVRG